MNLNAQCTPEPNLPDGFLGVWPVGESEEPCDTIIPSTPANQGELFEFTFTAFAPGEIEFSGNTVTLADVVVDSIQGLPEGLEYVCDQTDCVFPGGQGGCLKITGITTAPVGIYDLKIFATVNIIFVGPTPLPVTFPPDPGSLGEQLGLPACPYSIEVRDPSSNQSVIEEQVSIKQNTPNPFTDITNIEVNAKAGDYTFSVFNLLGEVVHTRQLTLNGQENIEFDASALDAGMYIYSISNENGSVSKRMMVQ